MIVTTNILRFYLILSIILVAIRNDMNLEPKLDDSTVLWRLLYYIIGEILTKIIIPV